MPLFPTQCHGETHNDGIEFTMDDGYAIEKGMTVSASIHGVNNGPFKLTSLGMREYLCVFGAMSLANQVFWEKHD